MSFAPCLQETSTSDVERAGYVHAANGGLLLRSVALPCRLLHTLGDARFSSAAATRSVLVVLTQPQQVDGIHKQQLVSSGTQDHAARSTQHAACWCGNPNHPLANETSGLNVPCRGENAGLRLLNYSIRGNWPSNSRSEPSSKSRPGEPVLTSDRPRPWLDRAWHGLPVPTAW